MTQADFIGMRVDAVTFADMFAAVDRWIADKDGPSHHIACLNAYCASLAHEDPKLAAIYEAADIAGPDGMPFVRWIRTVLRAPCDRFYGPDVICELAAHSEKTGYTFYLYGGTPETAQGMKAHLERRYPHIRIVGWHAPPFRPMTPDEDRAVCDEINALRPDIICVGLGTPKQDFWIADHREKIRGSVMLAVGAAFDFFGGRIQMAPRFVQRSGFEWLYRLASKDFGRLWRRYTIHNAHFMWHFARQLAQGRTRR